MLPKLRSGEELRVGVEFSVQFRSDCANSVVAELRQVPDDLGLGDQVHIEQRSCEFMLCHMTRSPSTRCGSGTASKGPRINGLIGRKRLRLQQAPLQQRLHVTPPVCHDQDVDGVPNHPVDDAVGFDKDLAVVPYPDVQ